jgi:triphosphoribosyl-dephospho-CoA synthase
VTALDPAAIEAAYRAACRAELEALKPGNVHVYADGHRMSVRDFHASAEASAPHLAAPGAGIGARVLGAVRATRAAVGQNTNLGILLLCAPLAAAAEASDDLEDGVARTLEALAPRDAADAFEAIRLAAPGGLGTAARHDVSGVPPASLLDAMREAAPRDRIARAYVTGFEDVFRVGLAALEAASALDEPWRATAVHLAYLARFPDTHIARKQGREAAEGVRARAAAITAGLDLSRQPTPQLLAFDAELKREGLNPGTTADFTVATLFAGMISALKRRCSAC